MRNIILVAYIIWALMLVISIAFILSSDMFTTLSGKPLMIAYLKLLVQGILFIIFVWLIVRKVRRPAGKSQ